MRGTTILVTAALLAMGLVGCSRSPSAAPAPTVDSGTDTFGTALPTVGPTPTVDITEKPVTQPPTTPTPPPVVPSPKDCLGYDPANLTVKSAGAIGWYMMDGPRTLVLFDTQGDAQEGVKVARAHTKHCFIGRGNDRADRNRYIVDYWEGSSGLPLGLAPTGSCSSYSPKNLKIVSAGADGWQLVDPTKDLILLLLDTAADAERSRLVAGAYGRRCAIGVNNTRSDKHRYIMDYWQ